MRNLLGFVSVLLFCTGVQADEFTLSSEAVPADSRLTDEYLFNGFGCSGDNVSPDLQWTPGPAGTQSYAVTVYDPDAPTGSGWWHWIVYDIPVDVTALSMGAGAVGGTSLPQGASHGPSDFGIHGFGGACPPEGHGDHRYVFTVFALKTDKLDVPDDATAALIGFMLNANALATAQFTATYGR
ncbi:MAG: YbhB/YbcL family Raf kinase inhibitor-like protein [Halioglobus sp.]|nr:YbhB/YbcL family Raf kinase inhibitor-like protein [Halioglobus sp.]